MIEANVRKKIETLIKRAKALVSVSPEFKDGDAWMASCATWEAETHNVVELAVPNPLNAYRRHISRYSIGGSYSERMQIISTMLEALLNDIDAGLLTALGNKVRAETFDNFLDHAEEYRRKGYKDRAGVIAGVVFEDAVRKIYTDKTGPHGGQQLEDLINGLAKQDLITGQQSKQAKVASHVRTQATHARWEEFDLEGVDATIAITKTFLREHMGG
jgi:hypothetical protein